MAEVDDFERLRPLLFSIAYRMLGSAAEAEDVVQDTWLRYSAARPAELRSPRAYLTTIATRLALDRLKSARARREQYVGPWLPEPMLTEGQPGPEQSLVLAESLTLAFMVLLETLSPEERAVFLLREAFDHSYGEIAAVVDTSEANCRQLFHRAKARLAAGTSRARRPFAERRKLAERFVGAMRTGDRDALARLLAADVGFWSDGGGRVVAARRPVLGREPVANLLLGIRRTALESAGAAQRRIAVELTEVNCEPAMLAAVDGQLDSVYVLSIADGSIAGIRVVRNPDKLGYIRRQLAAAAPRSAQGGPAEAPG
jgi:RNA polymerase sigma-70 factor (TIGR02957 family)